MPGEILSLAFSADGGVRVTVKSADLPGRARASYRLTAEEYAQIGAPAARTPISDEEMAFFSACEERRAAGERAVRILACGDNSAMGLYRKLRARGCAKAAAEAAVQEMIARGYLREEEQAYRAAVREANGKCRGPRRILGYLSEKGYPATLCRRVLARAEAEGDIDFDALRARLLAEKLPPDAPPEKKWALLRQNGF